MKYKIHNEWTNIASGTYYQDCVNTSYFELVEVFGEPDLQGSGDGKVQAEWIIEFEDGKVATIYDYKEYETSVEFVTDWHIGGKDSTIAPRVKEIIKKNLDRKCLV
jgi:hypothetical protein